MPTVGLFISIALLAVGAGTFLPSFALAQGSKPCSCSIGCTLPGAKKPQTCSCSGTNNSCSCTCVDDLPRCTCEGDGGGIPEA